MDDLNVNESIILKLDLKKQDVCVCVCVRADQIRVAELEDQGMVSVNMVTNILFPQQNSFKFLSIWANLQLLQQDSAKVKSNLYIQLHHSPPLCGTPMFITSQYPVNTSYPGPD